MTRLETKLAAIETAVKEGFASESEQMALIQTAIGTLTGTVEQKLSAIDAAMSDQTTRLETKLEAIRGALADSLANTNEALGLIQTALESLKDSIADNLVSKLTELNTSLNGNVVGVLTEIFTAIESRPDYSDILYAIQVALEDIDLFSTPKAPVPIVPIYVDEALCGGNSASLTLTVDELFGENCGYSLLDAKLPDGSANECAVEGGCLTYKLLAPTVGTEILTNAYGDLTKRKEDCTEEIVSLTVSDDAGNSYTVDVPISIIDDVPSISGGIEVELSTSNKTLDVDDTSINVSDLFGDIDAGADGMNTIVYEFVRRGGLATRMQVSAGEYVWSEVSMSFSGTTIIIGDIVNNHIAFVVSLQNDGTVKFDQQNRVRDYDDHSKAEISICSFDIKATLTDQDGDIATATSTISLKVTDCGQ